MSRRHHDRVSDRTLPGGVGGMGHQRPVDGHRRRATTIEVHRVDEAERARDIGRLRDRESEIRSGPAIDSDGHGPALGVDAGKGAWVAFDDEAVSEARIPGVDEAVTSLGDLVADVSNNMGTAVDDRLRLCRVDRPTRAVAQAGGDDDAVTDTDTAQLADPVTSRLERHLAGAEGRAAGPKHR